MSGERPRSALDRLRTLDAERTRSGGDARDDRPDGHRRRRGGVLAAISVVALLLWKSKALLLLLAGKLKFLLGGLKLLKLGKVFTTGWTMLLSMWVYAHVYGWPFAAGLVLLILVHELGHGWAARLVGMPVSAPVFIPFFGAMIALKRQPRTTFEDFVIGAGGPIVGALGGALCLALSPRFGEYGSQLLFVVGYFALVINLFNLIPVWQLDGARIGAPMTTRLWCLALVVLGVVTFSTAGMVESPNPLPLFVLFGVGYQAWKSWRAGRVARPEAALDRLAQADHRAATERDVEVTPNQRRAAAATYIVWTGLLIAATFLLHEHLPALPG